MLSPFELAVFLGVLQGLTEFLPVSGEAHLALARTLLELDQAGLGLSALLNAGTLLAALCYFRKRIAKITVDLWQRLFSGRLPARSTPGWDALLVLVAALPTALIALLVRQALGSWGEQPLAIGFGLITTALVLTSTLWARPGDISSPPLWVGLLLGIVQGLASGPGLSRSAAAIVAALWFGLRPERAFELSMLMSIPALAAPLVLVSFDGDARLERMLPVIVGASVAFVACIFALRLLRRAVVRGHLAWFALWLLPLALATLALAKALPS
jgi:undecaprenyl-diphosphatase